jgi:hypothetical protein
VGSTVVRFAALGVLGAAYMLARILLMSETPIE